MGNTIQCKCGVTIDITGTIPRKDGTKVWCRVCGTSMVHHHN
ncbi:MAG: hypothetical protein OSB30_01465 [Candidatus Poseidoniaceae archaeon]|nr:hypothetical protein [Candidatus Poseidoniaceae archaeon]